jgi:hypothetical protein
VREYGGTGLGLTVRGTIDAQLCTHACILDMLTTSTPSIDALLAPLLRRSVNVSPPPWAAR